MGLKQKSEFSNEYVKTYYSLKTLYSLWRTGYQKTENENLNQGF